MQVLYENANKRGRKNNGEPAAVVSSMFSQVTNTVSTMTSQLGSSSTPVALTLQDVQHNLTLKLEIVAKCMKVAQSSFERAKELCRTPDL
jgi:hypothetical protein